MAKFDWIPYLQGKYLTYYQWFAVLGSTALLLLAFISFVVYLILGKVPLKHRFTYLTKKSALEKLKTFFFNLTFCFISGIPLICAALDIIYLIFGIILMTAVLAAMVILDNGRRKWDLQFDLCDEDNYIDRSPFSTYMKLAFQIDPATKKKIIKMAIISTVLVLFMYKTCLCFYNIEIGYYNSWLGFGVNTYFTRLFQIKKACPPGKPCHMYSTVPEDATTAFFLNVHTHTDVKELKVYYRELLSPNVTDFQQVTASTMIYQGLEWKTTRNVHSALIYDLKPNTKYLTIVNYQGKNWTDAIYKTLPADPKTPIRMINAGDSGYTQGAVNLSKIVATLNPDIFFMGGDIAYDDNMPACSYTWDSFLGMYGSITQTLGYLMPIAVSVGNHDAGLNELPGVNITVNNHGPAFLIYFPQHYDRNSLNQVIKRVPPIQRRRSIYEFTFGNVLYLCLDSGYMHSFDGWQKGLMIDAFQRNREKIKFANYHVPIYSVCENFDKNPQRFLYALFHWVPNFDKYKVMTVFENHVHSFKRTKPLIGSSPSEKGTVYVGDGAYGALISEMCTPDASMDIFDSFSKSNNFWLSEIYQDRVVHTAYDSHNKIIDHFTQYTSDYRLNGTLEYSQPQINPTPSQEKTEISDL